MLKVALRFWGTGVFRDYACHDSVVAVLVQAVDAVASDDVSGAVVLDLA